MSTHPAPRGHAVVVQPDHGPSYWQPVPANGHADPTLTPDLTRFPALSMGYQTIAPGGGARGHSRIRYSVEQMADDALRLMDAVGIDSAHLVGHSTGGAIGQVIAIEHPERL